MILLLVIGISGLITGGIIGFLYVKGRLNSKLTELQLKNQNLEAVNTEINRKLVENATAKKLVEEELIKLDKSLAVLNSQIDSLNKRIEEVKRQNETLKRDSQLLQLTIQDAGKKQTRAETELSESKKIIEDLQNRETSLRGEINFLSGKLSTVKEENSELRAKNQETANRLKDQQEFINSANEKLKDAFSTLSVDALNKNNESFVTLAKSTLETQVTEAKGEYEKKQQAIDEIVKPLAESLNKFDTKVQELENTRQRQHGEINQFINGLQQSTEKLQKETGNLVSALKTSRVRGRYGEIALRRLVEFAGMTDYCDFCEQTSVTTDDGRLRPDMVINLPGNKTLVVDSKIPLDAYLAAFETTDEAEKIRLLTQHATAVRGHLKNLSEKAYWSQFENSPDYVIMYMQIESSFGSALEFDRTLIEDGINNRVIPGTPTTLITLLRTVSFSWQQTKVAENIEEIRKAGVELYSRTNTLLDHFSKIGAGLKSAVDYYNKAVGSLESRFIPHARRLKELGGSYIKSEAEEPDMIELQIRPIIDMPESEILNEEL